MFESLAAAAPAFTAAPPPPPEPDVPAETQRVELNALDARLRALDAQLDGEAMALLELRVDLCELEVRVALLGGGEAT